jgi:hypothetical protein
VVCRPRRRRDRRRGRVRRRQSGTLDFEAGHGTFITGIIQQLCPDAEVHIAGVLSSFGDGDVANVIGAFELADTTAGPFDIVVMSLGGYMSDDDGELFGAALRACSATGSASRRPATSRRPRPTSRRAPRHRRRRRARQADKAWFTNFGGWVDACAPAIDVVSTFFVGPNDDLDEPFTGWAAGAAPASPRRRSPASIARRCTSPAIGRERCGAAVDYRRYRFPDLGTVFNV